MEDYYSSPPPKLADPHERRVNRRHYAGGSHDSDNSAKTLHPLSSGSRDSYLLLSIQRRTTLSDSSLLNKGEPSQKPSPGSSNIYDSPCIGNHCSALFSNEVEQNVSCDAGACTHDEQANWELSL